MMKRLHIIALIMITPCLLFSQQVGLFSHSFYKMMVFNPAYTGYDETPNAFLASRMQWIDFKNAPRLNIFSLDGALNNKKMGLGMGLISDQKGISNKIGGNASYSYKLKFNDDTYLALGLSLGVLNHTLNYSRAIVEDPSDPVLMDNTQSETSIDANAGLAFRWKYLELGVSVPQLLGGSLEYQDNVTGKAFYALSRHYMGSLRYRIMLSKEKDISLTPLALVRYMPNAPIQYDGNLNLEWKDKFWIGATYKSDYAVSANAGFCLSKQLYMGYSYDIIIGNIGKYSGMAHEVMLQFKFGKSKLAEGSAAPVEEAKTTPVVNDQLADSLQTELEIKDEKIRSDAQRLKANEQKIKELNEALEKAKAAGAAQQQPPVNTTNPSEGTNATPPVKTNGNQNAMAVSANPNKTMDNGVWMATNTRSDFKDSRNSTPQKGFYVIVGTFVYRDFAQAEVKRFANQGHRAANWVFFEPKQYNYVFVDRFKTKEEAIKKANDMKAAGVTDAWIQVIME